MIVLKKTYNELFEIIRKEKLANLDIYNQLQKERVLRQEAQRELYNLKAQIEAIKDLL